ncbi:hypothetical protein CDD82_5557 [Ophiocordyceps australis]|uniref:18S rRNA factor 2 n=1 Tax=Ophiocordyceps australis TaxID=1399860 RepID=A0A2C5Y5C1_9HYPO|nr:hypothetical protein CDD82_5557 [Ophiocordyceps australis]
MAPQIRNDFLDASESDDDANDGYESTDALEKGGRSVKRRKLDSDDDDDDDTTTTTNNKNNKNNKNKDKDNDGDNGFSHADSADAGNASGTCQARKSKSAKPQPEHEAKLSSISKPLSKKNLVATEKAIKKSGVVFLSRVPPFMRPNKLRSLLQPYGVINRIFLAPEDPAVHARRVRAGGNKRRSFTEGWVEFVKKREAKAACELLNARIIGGKKSSYYHDDIWNLLYLKGFKWHHLTQQITIENAERTSRMRAEISRATKENKEFVRNVEQSKMLHGMQAKSKKRKLAADIDGETFDAVPDAKACTFKQVSQISKAADEHEQPDRVTRVLGKIF